MKFKDLKFVKKAAEAVRPVVMKVEKHSPEIMLVTGVVTLVGAGIWACVESTKLKDDVQKTCDDLEKIHKAHEEGEIGVIDEKTGETVVVPYEEKHFKKDLCVAYVKGTGRVIKRYTGPAIVAAVGVFSIAKGYTKKNAQFKDMLANYGSLMAAHNAYRERVKEKFGEEVENQIFNGISKVEVEERKVDEKSGEEVIEKKPAEILDERLLSPYSFILGPGDTGMERNSEYNMGVLLNMEDAMNKILKARAVVDKRTGKTLKEGVMLMNEMLRMLDIPETRTGAVMGVTYDPNREPSVDHPNCVNLGLIDISNKRFINHFEDSVMLHIKVDSEPVWDKI